MKHGSPTLRPGACSFMSHWVGGSGLRGEEGLHAVRGLRSVVHGFASLEVAGGFGLPLNLDESFRRLVEMFIHGLQKEGAGFHPAPEERNAPKAR